MGVARIVWRTYRRTAAVGVLVGAAVGILFFFIIGGDGRLPFVKVAFGSAIGAATACVACVGGFLALRCLALRPTSSVSAVTAGAGGAGAAVFAVWLILAVLVVVVEGTAAFLLIFLPVAIVAGVVTWVLAAFALQWRENRVVGTSAERPSSHPPAE